MQVRVLASLNEVSPREWDALERGASPFLSHAYLAALEASGAVGEDTGWLPMHLALEDGHGRLRAALPLYAKHHSWGEFGHYGSRRDRERASIWKPYTYDFRFLERTMGVPAFRDVYKAKLEYALEHLFTKERLFAQIDELAATIRPAVAAESDYRLKRFDVAVSDDSSGNPPGESIHQIKRFIENRIISVRAQLKV